jgi:predicted secreted protein
VIATIATPAEYYGHLDGAAAASNGGTARYGDRAFEARLTAAHQRLDETDREVYTRCYTEAFDAQRALLQAGATRSQLVIQ